MLFGSVPLGVCRDEHTAVMHAHHTRVDGDLDGLAGEPHTDPIAVAGKGDLAVAAHHPVVTGPIVSASGSSTVSGSARRNPSQGAIIPMP